MTKRIAPETRLHRASMIIRQIRELGGEVVPHEGTVWLAKQPGLPLFRQLMTFYPKEAAACLSAEAAIRTTDHV